MTAPKPVSLDFDDLPVTVAPLPMNFGTFRFTLLNGPDGSLAQIVPDSADPADHFLRYQGALLPVTVGFGLTALDGSSFSLQSIELLATSNPVQIILSGYDAQGGLIASDTVTPGTADSTGSVRYTIDTNGGQRGTLKFDASWASVAKVTFNAPTAVSGPSYFLDIDDIVLKTASVDLAEAGDSGAKGDHITRFAQPLFTGSADADTTLDVFVDGASVRATTTTTDADGSFSIDDLHFDEDGEHTVTVKSPTTDDDGFSVTFTLDTRADAPTGLALDPSRAVGDAADHVTSDTTPLVSGKAEAHARVVLYEGETELGWDTADAEGNWEITASTLDDGAHTLSARQTDVAGNLSQASTALAITVDSGRPSKPALSADSDSGAKGDGITNDATPTFTGSALAGAVVTLTDGDGAILGQGLADHAGKWSITVGESLASTVAALQDGAYMVHAVIAAPADPEGDAPPATIAGPELALTIDTGKPAAPAAPTLAAASDSGAIGDKITTVRTPILDGSAERKATVAIYDNGNFLGSSQADGEGQWHYQAGTLAVGAHALTAIQTDVAGNVSDASGVLALTIEAAPVPAPTPRPTPAPTVDGVPVTSTQTFLPGGTFGTAVRVPVIGSGRVEQDGAPDKADIPLAKSGTTTLLTAQVHTGFGLNASGATLRGADAAIAELVASIKATGNAHGGADVPHLAAVGQSFLSLLPTDASLLVQTVQLTGGATGGALDLVGSGGTAVALVLDGAGVAAGTAVTLQNIPFASVFGALAVSGATAGQIISGDAAAQSFTVVGAASKVLAGGGADILAIAADGGSAAGAAHAATSGTSTTLLHGGSGADQAVFGANADQYTIAQHDGYVLVSSKATPEQVTQVVNVESLSFADQSIAVRASVAQSALAGLYQDVLGRQADLGGFGFWAGAERAGTDLGSIALDMIGSEEGAARFGAFDGDAAHDVAILYQAILGRSGDAAGSAYWIDQMAKGVTLGDVAEGFMQSAEVVGHQQAAIAWDFTV